MDTVKTVDLREEWSKGMGKALADYGGRQIDNALFAHLTRDTGYHIPYPENDAFRALKSHKALEDQWIRGKLQKEYGALD